VTAVLKAMGLGKRHRRRWALSHCTLDIPAGQVVGLVGPNGAGKTTLLFIGITPNLPGAWISSSQVTTAAGSTYLGPHLSACGPNATYSACVAAIARMHLRQVLVYQPASRFWALQWYETAIYLALALALAGFCVWWVRRRVS
jgi:energy-coupling factor transporter ATP-binding protein EcfA2